MDNLTAANAKWCWRILGNAVQGEDALTLYVPLLSLAPSVFGYVVLRYAATILPDTDTGTSA